MNKKICCVAGKSGGHIIPCLIYAQSLQKESTPLLFFTTHTALDTTIIKNFSMPINHITLPFDGIPTKKIFFLI